MAAVNKRQMEEFLKTRTAAAEALSKITLKDNPNITYGSVISPAELEMLAHSFSPKVGELAAIIYKDNPERLEGYETAQKNIGNKLKDANRPPLLRVGPFNNSFVDSIFPPNPNEYDVRKENPEFQRRLDIYNLTQGALQETDLMADPTYFPDGDESTAYRTPPLPQTLLFQDDLDKYAKPTTTVGLEKIKRQALRGYDGRPENQLKVDSSKTPGLPYEALIALNPREMTLENHKFLADKFGLKGEFRYVNPSLPTDGVVFKREGEENFQIINSPKITWSDTFRVLVQEAPAIIGDVGLALLAQKFMSSKTGLEGNLFMKAAKILGLSGASGIGAAGLDFTRLLVGKAQGAHDLDFKRMADEAGVTGAWAFGGTAVISTSAMFLTKLYKAITRGDVPPEMWETIDDALQAARKAEKTGEAAPTPGLLYGDTVTVKELNKQLNLLADRFKTELPDYNPTLAAQAGTQSAADLETVFLKYADDPKVRDLYKQIKNGNQEVIDRFFDIIAEKIGPTTGKATDATAAELGGNLRLLAQKDINQFEKQMREMVDKVRRQVSPENINEELAGTTLLREVPNVEKSSLPLFERLETRFNELRKQYTKPFNDAWEEAVASDVYKNLRTGAGRTRGPLTRWKRARAAEADELLKSSEADEAVGDLYKMLPEGSKNTIQRLAGRGEKGFENPQFTINELNKARVTLNEFASNLPDNRGGTRKLANELMTGIEEQMNVLVREGASLESGIPMTSKVKLNKWIEKTKYGDDLREAWSAQSTALQLVNSETIRSFARQNRPEKVAEYILSTSAKGSPTNSVMTELMTVLKKNGSDEVTDMQNGLAAYIRREFLENPDGLPEYQIAKQYRKFLKEHKGTLKALFGDEYTKRFGSPGEMNKIIKQLDETNETILRLQARFGMAKQGDPNRKVTNIVESILNTGATQKQSGIILEDIKYLVDITKGDEVLQKQIAQVTKRWMLDNIITPKQGAGTSRELSPDKLLKLLTEGFGPEELVGPQLTFDNFFLPLLGKDGPELLKNLKYLNNMVQREIGVEPSAQIVRAIKEGEFGPASNIEGAGILQKLLIAPLTKTGRRLTAATRRQIENSRKFIGEMLMDNELFSKSMSMAKGTENTQRFIRFLTAYGVTHVRDIGNEIKYYDTTEKKQKTPPKKEIQFDFPDRFYEFWEGRTD